MTPGCFSTSRVVAALALLWFLAALGCGRQAPALGASAAEGLRVVATHSILGDIVAHVGGDRVRITTLVGPDGDAHTFEPKPSDAAALCDAALVFENGLGLEAHWLDKLYKASGTKAARVVASRGIAARTLEEDGRQETDPHCWHDVRNVILMAGNVREALAAADPSGAAAYEANAQRYLASLEELDRSLVSAVQALPPGRRILMTSHDSLGYFAGRYGFKILSSPLGSASTEASDPSAAKIAQAISEIRGAGVPAVFIENMHNPKVMQQIARDAGVKVVTELYTDALGPQGSPGETYLKMMRFNVDAIVGALKP
jgi:zinc/manganese transport system substrate-binding protein